MEHDESVRDPVQGTPTDSHLNRKTLFGLTMVFYALLELEFVRRIWSLIGKHAPLDYAVNGVAFEACFIASAFYLWRCLHLARTGEEAMKNHKEIMSGITVLVAMLLLALMQFSSFTQAYDKTKP